jgi:hypothetical protein
MPWGTPKSRNSAVAESVRLPIRISDDALGLAVSFLMGTLAFYLVVGPRPLDPTDIAWFSGDDPIVHYLGWQFFRNTAWSFPIGLNPDFGLELSNSIVYSDSVPLLAILLKPFSGFLPAQFQYTGIWLYACLLLQAWFGWKLAGLVSDRLPERVLVVGFFLVAPPLLYRVEGHFALASHFLILAALYLALRPNHRSNGLAWCLLMVVAALVHAYLLGMVAILWVADLLQRGVTNAVRPGSMAVEFFGSIAVLAFVCWQVGYFSVLGGASSGGFGFYRMNLLSLGNAHGWSYVLRDLKEGRGDYEGFNFLGLGLILLAVPALSAFLKDPDIVLKAMRRHALLVLALLALFLLALSNKIALGASTLVEVPLPDWMLNIAGVFRSSGRMFWPVYYALVLIVLLMIVRCYRKFASVLLGIALIVQTLDTSHAWLRMRREFNEPAFRYTPLKQEFWDKAAQKYSRVRRIMPGSDRPEWWDVFAEYAELHGLSTDSVWLARMSADRVKAAKAKALEALATGRYEPDALYIVDGQSAAKAAAHLDASSDLLTRIDGFVVLAPGWKKCDECMQISDRARKEDLFEPVESGRRISFTKMGRGAQYLGDGWSRPEGWGVWSRASEASLTLPMSVAPNSVVLELDAFVKPEHPQQNVDVTVNGVAAAKIQFTQYSGNQATIPVPLAAQETIKAFHFLRMGFKFSNAMSPSDLELSRDARRLAIGLRGLTVH